MQIIDGFGIHIRQSDRHVLFQCPACNPKEPHDLGDVKNIIHIEDVDNDGLADISKYHFSCPDINCNTRVMVPVENAPQFEWGKQLQEIFADKRAIFNDLFINFTGLDVELIGSPHYLDDNFTLSADATHDKKFKIVFAINDLEQFDLWITTQIQDDASDWGALPVGWTILDCVMSGTILTGATNISSSDVVHILDGSKITGLV